MFGAKLKTPNSQKLSAKSFMSFSAILSFSFYISYLFFNFEKERHRDLVFVVKHRCSSNCNPFVFGFYPSNTEKHHSIKQTDYLKELVKFIMILNRKGRFLSASSHLGFHLSAF